MYQFLVNAYTIQRTVEYLVHTLVGNVGNRCFQVALILVQDGINLPEYHLVLVFSQWHNTAFVNVLLGVWNDFGHINFVDITQALTTWTSALGRVE